MPKHTKKRLKHLLPNIPSNFTELIDYIIYYDSINEDLVAWDIIYTIEEQLEHLTEIELLVADFEKRTFPLKADLLYNGMLYALVNNEESKEVLIDFLQKGEHAIFKKYIIMLDEQRGRDGDLNMADVIARLSINADE